MTADPQDSTAAGRVFSIAPGAPFLKVLARSLVDGELVPGFVPRSDPLLLADATIYLPTRRAARALAAEFIDAFGGGAALLPVIRTLGDGDGDEFDFAAIEAEHPELPPPIGDLERRLHLARLVRGWTNALSHAKRDLFKDEDIAVPSSAADAIRMAADLSRLMDSMSTEEVGPRSLAGLSGTMAADEMPERWAQWWNYTLHFLTIVTESWPPSLTRSAAATRPSTGACCSTCAPGGCYARRDERAGDRRRFDRIDPGDGAADRGHCRLAKGAVVLPGVDLSLDEATWEMLARPDAEGAIAAHPQFGLARLLKAIGIDRGAVRELGKATAHERIADVSAGIVARFEDRTLGGQDAARRPRRDRRRSAGGGAGQPP